MAVYNRKDSYYKKAKKEGYKSRAAYKLKELNTKYKIMKKGSKVLDCGAAPGGWSQVALEIVEEHGLVVGVDLNEVKGINNKNFICITGDFTTEEIISSVLEKCDKYDCIISDIAPHTIGIRDADHTNSLELVEKVYTFAMQTLKKDGSFLFKLFEGQGRKGLVERLKKDFKDVRIIKPDATRQGSMEIYIAALYKLN